ncbi:hypothetical protein D3C71_2237160 [compost metagenome]
MVRPVGFWKLGSTYRKRALSAPVPTLATRSSMSTPWSSLATATTLGSMGVKAWMAPR